MTIELYNDDRQRCLMFNDLVDDANAAPIASKADFLDHLPYMEGFHQRYMVSNKVCRLWANMARQLYVARLVPQHGRDFKGREAITAFLDWIEALEYGFDLFTQDNYALPK
ncbi:MAG: hypothetical protein MUC79_09230 [Thiobacillaceae bacterium]|jgi:flavorubredoxin|nr:hypothetical protein [Thiobacillaceae bacterium]